MDRSLLEKAREFTSLSLAGKKRYSGESFVEHGLKVAKILESYHVNDSTTLAVAILHHGVADGAASFDDLEKEFGGEITQMVKTLESLRVIKLADVTNKEFVESLRRMFLVLAKDMRIVLIKLGDILDNLTTLAYLPKQKQIEVAKETIEIFAPLAERLGMGEAKGQMQDLAFAFLEPEDYQKVKKLLKTSLDRLSKVTLGLKVDLEKVLTKEDVKYRLEYRTKHIYSLYTKLKREEVGFDISKVYDLIAFRVIVENVEDCYRVLGIVHKLWRPMPDYVRDYIANPKTNGYQSIHTTVFGPGGVPFEIQIRTEKMHEEAEFGVAAHWHYSETKSQVASGEILEKGVRVDSGKLDWVKRLGKWQEEITDNEEFLKSIKTDFFGERIYVFTPKGDVKDLPVGATTIDFAYAVHSGLGDLATGARVNGRLVSLDTKLKNSDVCEIIVSKHAKKPNRDWLNFVVTLMAKKKIKKAYLMN